jgi:hypothetical protein
VVIIAERNIDVDCVKLWVDVYFSILDGELDGACFEGFSELFVAGS